MTTPTSKRQKRPTTVYLSHLLDDNLVERYGLILLKKAYRYNNTGYHCVGQVSRTGGIRCVDPRLHLGGVTEFPSVAAFALACLRSINRNTKTCLPVWSRFHYLRAEHTEAALVVAREEYGKLAEKYTTDCLGVLRERYLRRHSQPPPIGEIRRRFSELPHEDVQEPYLTVSEVREILDLVNPDLLEDEFRVELGLNGRRAAPWSHRLVDPGTGTLVTTFSWCGDPLQVPPSERNSAHFRKGIEAACLVVAGCGGLPDSTWRPILPVSQQSSVLTAADWAVIKRSGREVVPVARPGGRPGLVLTTSRVDRPGLVLGYLRGPRLSGLTRKGFEFGQAMFAEKATFSSAFTVEIWDGALVLGSAPAFIEGNLWGFLVHSRDAPNVRFDTTTYNNTERGVPVLSTRAIRAGEFLTCLMECHGGRGERGVLRIEVIL